MQHRPADGYRSGSAAGAGIAPEREALASVLDEIARRFGTDLSSVASEAAEELCREIHAPGSVLPQAPSLLAVLRTCPPEHQGQIERSPEEVLAAIRGYEVRQDRLPPDEPLGEVIPHDQLVHRVGLQIAADEPLRGGFVALLLGYGFPEIGQGLERWSRLSQLGDLMAGGGDPRDWVARTRIVLLQWRAYIEAASDGTDQISGFAAKEIFGRNTT